jgi:hypothetical protein
MTQQRRHDAQIDDVIRAIVREAVARFRREEAAGLHRVQRVKAKHFQASSRGRISVEAVEEVA